MTITTTSGSSHESFPAQPNPLLAFHLQELNSALGRLYTVLEELTGERPAHLPPEGFPRSVEELLDRLAAQQAADEFSL
jgi:hypothetical protein